jgi:hypothetical protein
MTPFEDNSLIRFGFSYIFRITIFKLALQMVYSDYYIKVVKFVKE